MGVSQEVLLSEQIDRVVNPALVGYLGVERESFLVNNFHYAPCGDRVVRKANCKRVVSELPAVQVETVSSPHFSLAALGKELQDTTAYLDKVAHGLGLSVAYREVAPTDVPSKVSRSDPHYTRVANTISPERLKAACRVAGTHVHVGVGSIEEAILVHNALVDQLNKMIDMGDHSDGERLELYKVVTQGDCWPIRYESVEHFNAWARERGMVSLADLRSNWHLVRITRHGTVEVRVFGNTRDISEVLLWAQFVRDMALVVRATR